jgi:hypothetical protein
MKRLFFFIGAIFFICFSLYAADEQPKTNTRAFELPPIVFDTIYRSEFLSTSSFLLLDGTYLNYDEMKERLIIIPQNEKYLSRAKGFEIGGFIGLGAGVAAGIAYIVFSYIPDLPNRDILKTAGYTGVIAGLGGGIISFNQSYRNLHRAIRNYNLSVMGIPIL